MYDLPQVASSDAELDRRAASRDLWPGGTLAMWHGEPAPAPARVWWPEDDDEVAAVLAAASDRGVVVVPYGAGSGVCGGARGREGAWVVDTKRFDQIGAVDERWIVEVGAGVNGEVLERALAAQGFTLGHSPSSIGCSTVGGWAAARSAGQFSSKYGVFEDMVVGLDAVSPATGAFCVGLPGAASPSRRAPDAWMPMLLGSEGTMAVVTRLRLRVRPLPETRWLRGYRAPDVPTALAAMRELLQGELWPSAVRLYDPMDTLIGGKTRPKPARVGPPPWWQRWLAAVDDVDAVRRRALTLPLALPGLLQQIAEGFTRGCLLIVGFEGPRAVVEAASAAGHARVVARCEDLGPEPGTRWYASRHAVSYKLMPVFEHGGFADTMEVAARWSVLPGLYEGVRRAVRPHALVMAHMSHSYPEGGCIYFSFAGRGDRATYEAVWEAALRAVAEHGGTCTHHHGVGTLKAGAASREVGAAVVHARTLQRELDPRGVMNPGVVYTREEVLGEPPEEHLAAEDGLRRVPATAPFDALRALHDGEPRWPWERLPEPARQAREPYMSGWQEVRARAAGHPVALGRGPRSAAGPDLRLAVVAHDPDASASVAWCRDEDLVGAWMGEATVEAPWRVAQAVLRADLRPAVLAVVDGCLRVGFRGPAARAFGALASAAVPGGLREVGWTPSPRASGPLLPCAPEDPRCVAVTCESGWRRPTHGEDA